MKNKKKPSSSFESDSLSASQWSEPPRCRPPDKDTSNGKVLPCSSSSENCFLSSPWQSAQIQARNMCR